MVKYRRAWLIWLVGICYYFYQYVVRVSPSVMVSSFSQDFHLTAMSYGIMSSYYFYSYALMQAPAGVVVDKFGAKYPMVWACGLLALSCFLFDQITYGSLWEAELLRLLMGLGSAFAFIGVMRLCAAWFPPEKFSFLCGLTNAVGMSAGFIGSAPLAWIELHHGWPYMYLVLACVGIVITTLMGLVIKDRPMANKEKKDSVRLADFLTVLKSPKNWYLGIQGGCFWFPISGLGALWGTDYIETMYGISETVAAAVSGSLFLGALVGTVLFGWLMALPLFKKNLSLMASVLGLVVSICVVWVPVPVEFMAILLFLLGMYTSGQVIIYVLAKEDFRESLSGAVIGLINALLVGLGALSEPIIGMLINMHATGSAADSHIHYTLADFNFAMTSVPCVCLLNLLMSIGYKMWSRHE